MKKPIPSTPEEDFAEMRRLWLAQAKNGEQYWVGAILKASGGAYPKGHPIYKRRQG